MIGAIIGLIGALVVGVVVIGVVLALLGCSSASRWGCWGWC